MTCTATGGLACTPAGLSFNTATNRINSSGCNYDAAGNLTSDKTLGYVFDLGYRGTRNTGIPVH